MRFYRLRDDFRIPRRWHLGDVRMGEQTGLLFDAGTTFTPERPLSVGIATPGGLPLDFTLTTLGVPIVFDELARRIATIADSDVQFLPVWVEGLRGPPGGRTEFAVLNTLRVVSCLDERRSEFSKWTDADHRDDLAGQYRQVTRLVVDRSRIPDDAHVFRVEGWRIALIVSELVKRAIERFGCRGARFEEVA